MTGKRPEPWHVFEASLIEEVNRAEEQAGETLHELRAVKAMLEAFAVYLAERELRMEFAKIGIPWE